MDRHSRAPKKNTGHGNEVLPQDTTHFIQRPGYQRGSPCQNPTGYWTTRRPDYRKETQTAMIWACLPFIRSGQSHLARHSERGKKTRQTEEEVGRQNQGMDRLGVRQSQRAVVNRGKWGKLVVKSSVVPQRPSRLRNRWWWWWWWASLCYHPMCFHFHYQYRAKHGLLLVSLNFFIDSIHFFLLLFLSRFLSSSFFPTLSTENWDRRVDAGSMS